MEARITRLQELASDLRRDVIKLQTAESIAAQRRHEKSIAIHVLTDALYAIVMIGVGVFLGIAITIDPDRASKATHEVHSSDRSADVRPKSPPDIELNDAPASFDGVHAPE